MPTALFSKTKYRLCREVVLQDRYRSECNGHSCYCDFLVFLCSDLHLHVGETVLHRRHRPRPAVRAAAAGFEDGILEPDPGPVGVHPPETSCVAASVSSALAQQGHFNPEWLVQEFRAIGNPFALASRCSHDDPSQERWLLKSIKGRHTIIDQPRSCSCSRPRGSFSNLTKSIQHQHASGLL